MAVDKVVLALGNFTAHTQPHLANKPGYIDSLWPLHRLDKISPSSSICIVSSRLSRIDAAFHPMERGHKGPVYLVSRKGRLPKVQGSGRIYSGRYALHILVIDLEQIPPLSRCYEACFRSRYEAPRCPDLRAPAKPVTIQDLEKLILKLIGKYLEDTTNASEGTGVDPLEDAKLKQVARASLLTFKKVNKMCVSKPTYL